MAAPTRRPKKRPKASPARGGFKKKGTTMARPSKSARLDLAPPRVRKSGNEEPEVRRRQRGRKRTVPKSTDLSDFKSHKALEEQAEKL